MVRINSEAVPSTTDGPEMIMATYSNRHQQVGNEALFALFPGDVAELNHGIFFPAAEVANKHQQHNHVSPAVVGVVTYKTANNQAIRQSVYFYHIACPGTNGSAMIVEPSDTFHLPMNMALVGPPIVTAT